MFKWSGTYGSSIGACIQRTSQSLIHSERAESGGATICPAEALRTVSNVFKKFDSRLLWDSCYGRTTLHYYAAFLVEIMRSPDMSRIAFAVGSGLAYKTHHKGRHNLPCQCAVPCLVHFIAQETQVCAAHHVDICIECVDLVWRNVLQCRRLHAVV